MAGAGPVECCARDITTMYLVGGKGADRTLCTGTLIDFGGTPL